MLTHLLDWKVQSYSFLIISFVSFAPFIPLVPSRIRSKFSEGVSTRFSASSVPTTRHLVRDLIGLFLLVVGSVAIHLVHEDADLFHFEKVDLLWMLSRLSLDFTAIFAT